MRFNPITGQQQQEPDMVTQALAILGQLNQLQQGQEDIASSRFKRTSGQQLLPGQIAQQGAEMSHLGALMDTARAQMPFIAPEAEAKLGEQKARTAMTEAALPTGPVGALDLASKAQSLMQGASKEERERQLAPVERQYMLGKVAGQGAESEHQKAAALYYLSSIAPMIARDPRLAAAAKSMFPTMGYDPREVWLNSLDPKTKAALEKVMQPQIK